MEQSLELGPHRKIEGTENQNLDLLSASNIFAIDQKCRKEKPKERSVFPSYCHIVSFIIEHEYF